MLDRGGGFDVEHGIEAKRIREVQFAARELVLIAAEIHLAGEQMNVAEQDGAFPGAANAQAGVDLKIGTGPLHAGVGAGVSLKIEL